MIFKPFQRYFTFQEALALVFAGEVTDTSFIYFEEYGYAGTFFEYWADKYNAAAFYNAEKNIMESTAFVNLINKYIFPVYFKDYVSSKCFYSPKECEEYEPTLADFAKFWSRFFEVSLATYDRYSALISYYTAQEGKLMDDLKSGSSTVAKFNDTPQDGGDLDDDDHISTITHGETESWSADTPPIVRLEEIRRTLVNLYEEWRNEYASLFIHNDESEDDDYES